MPFYRFFVICVFILTPLFVNAQVTVNFNATKTSGCPPLITQFHDASTGGPISSYSWEYVLHAGSGTTEVNFSNAPDPVITFTASGTYDIIETVTSGTVTATDTQLAYIHVSNAAISFTTTAIATDTLLSCPGKSVTFVNTSVTDSSPGCSPSFQWYIFNVNTGSDTTLYTTGISETLPYIFNVAGYYDISLNEEATCNCNGIANYNSFIKIDSLPVACYSVTNSNLCGPPDTVNFNSGCTTGAYSYLWGFGGGGGTSTLANPTHIFTAAGTYSDTLTAYSLAGCPTVIRHPSEITVGHFNPAFYINATPPFCTTFYNFQSPASIGSNISWHDATNTVFAGDTHGPSVYFPGPGEWTMIDSVWDTVTMCYGTYSVTFTINPLPEIVFSATPSYACTPDLISDFTATITDTSGVDSVHWNFGDPSSGVYDTSILLNPTHTYSVAGHFTPILYVKGNDGCSSSDSIVHYIGIYPPTGHINASIDSGCAPVSICINAYITPAVTFTTDEVNYGDGSAPCIGDSCGTACHTYTAGGTYTMKHYYHLPEGCSYTDSVHIVVGDTHPIMHPYALPDSVCPNSEVYFRDSCSNCTSFQWYFGDGTVSTHPDDSDEYTTTGLITVVATGDVNGCTIAQNIHVHVLGPAANIADSVGSCNVSNVIYFNSAGSTGATSYHWTFGDGFNSNLANPTHTYTVPVSGESYSVTLVDSGGGSHHCYNTASIAVNLYPIIDTFNANPTTACRLTNVLFTGPTPQQGGYYSQYIWTFSSPDTTIVQTTGVSTLSYSFFDTGTYTVQLIVFNSFGCSDTLTKTGYLHVSGPMGGLTASEIYGCSPLTDSFFDHNSVLAGNTITSRQWQFSSPGSVSGVSNAIVHGSATDTFYTYPTGTFLIALIDSDNNHCFSYDTVRIHAESPNAYFTANRTSSCIGIPVTFTDTNTHCTYVWNFGDGATGTGQVANHVYTANGTYTVSVTITSGPGTSLPTGCINTYTRNAYIHISSINASFILNDSFAICPPLFVLANATSGSSYNYYWDINHTPLYSPGSAFNPTFNLPGIYTITLLDSNAIGCRDSVSKTVEIDGPSGIITSTLDSGCVPLTVTLNFNDTNGTAVIPNFTWITGDDSVYYFIDTPGITHTYFDTGSFLPSVTISSAGCAVTITSVDSIRVFPVPVVTVSHPGIICYDADTVLIATGALPGDTYSWSPGYGLSCTLCAHPVASPTVNTTYTVTLTSIHGCSDTAITTVAVDSQLTLHVIGYDSVCLGKCDTLIAFGVLGNYLWTPDTALSAATHDTVIACATASRNYTVTATDNRGCSASAPFFLIINPLPHITISPANPYVCYDSTQIITAQGAGPGGTYVWSPNVFISNTTISDPTFSDTSNTVYKVVATTQYGCVDSDIDVFVTVYDSAITTISNDTIICQGNTAQLYATSTSGNLASYLWTPAAGLNNDAVADPQATPDTTTIYFVHIQENPCFSADRGVTVTVVPNPDILLPAASTIIAGSSVQLSATVGNSSNVTIWAWTPSGTLSCDSCYNPVATPTMTTTYTVKGTTPIGCTSENSVQVSLICAEASQVFVPNTFTPNGDGVNDRFYLSGKGLGLISRMSVYNRWGEQVFEAENINANDPGAGWDGTYKGQVLPPDVFIYVFQLECETGVPFVLKGDISLVR